MSDCSPIPIQELIDKLSNFKKESNVELHMDYYEYDQRCTGLVVSWQTLETDEQHHDRVEKYRKYMFRLYMDPVLKAEENQRKRTEKAKKKQAEKKRLNVLF
jgi:hypothetical protein